MKYRLYNDEDKRMEKVTEMSLSPSGWICTSISDEGEDSEWNCVQPLMQSTGRKDLTGTEIYEGDIVSSNYYRPDIKCIAPIKYDTESMAFIADDPEQDAYRFGGLTIIGNIHMNKDLLNN